MKVSGIISALVFAHVALGQASDSTSSGSKTGNKSASHSQTASASSSATPGATPTGSTSSVGSLTKEVTGDSNPLLPSGISTTCTDFLVALNSNANVTACLTGFNTALSSFTSSQDTKSAMPKALGSLCSTNACDALNIGSKLTEFKDACSDELTGSNPNDVVIQQYDMWYSIFPFKSAMCAKVDGAYCLINATSSSSSTTQNTRRSDVNYVAGHLVDTINKRAQTVLVPNAETYSSNNLLYLFISSDVSQDHLCTPCTQEVVSKYVAFGSSVQHALGTVNSPLLGGMTRLWADMANKCGTPFTERISALADTPTAGELADGAVTTTASYFTALAAAFAAAFALF